MTEPRVTGQQAILNIGGGDEIPVTNVSWDREVNTTDVQYSDSLKPYHVITGLRYSGSFEYDGMNADLETVLWSDGGGNIEDGEPARQDTLTVQEDVKSVENEGTSSRTVTFANVIVTGKSRDAPSDDVSSTTYNWVAEDVSVS